MATMESFWSFVYTWTICYSVAIMKKKMFAEFKQSMFKEFEITDNSLMSYFLDIEVKQENDEIFIMESCNAVNTLNAVWD